MQVAAHFAKIKLPELVTRVLSNAHCFNNLVQTMDSALFVVVKLIIEDGGRHDDFLTVVTG